jgi:Flp pilus assembly protein TadB
MKREGRMSRYPRHPGYRWLVFTFIVAFVLVLILVRLPVLYDAGLVSIAVAAFVGIVFAIVLGRLFRAKGKLQIERQREAEYWRRRKGEG